MRNLDCHSPMAILFAIFDLPVRRLSDKDTACDIFPSNKEVKIKPLPRSETYGKEELAFTPETGGCFRVPT